VVPESKFTLNFEPNPHKFTIFLHAEKNKNFMRKKSVTIRYWLTLNYRKKSLSELQNRPDGAVALSQN
jgi:hypothetical protein